MSISIEVKLKAMNKYRHKVKIRIILMYWSLGICCYFNISSLIENMILSRIIQKTYFFNLFFCLNDILKFWTNFLEIIFKSMGVIRLRNEILEKSIFLFK